MYKIISAFTLLFILVMMSACGEGSNQSKAKFNPFKIASIKSENLIMKVASNSNFFAIADSNASNYGYIKLFSIDDDGKYRELHTIKNEDNDTKFGYEIAMDESYLATGNYLSDKVYIYKLDKNADATLITTIDGIEKTSSAHGRTLAIDANYLLIGTFADSSKGSKAYLYSIKPNGSVQLEHTFNQPSQTYTYFTNSLDIDGDIIAIGEARGYKIHIYNRDNNGSIREKYIISPSEAVADKLYHFELSLINGYLLSGSSTTRKAYLFNIKDDTNITQTSLPPASNIGGNLYGRSIAANSDTLLIEGSQGITLYRLNDENLSEPIALQDTQKTAYNSIASMSISGKKFIRNFSNGTSASIYSTYAKNQIYLYNTPKNPIEIPEAEPPYDIFCIDASSTQSNLSFKIIGDDAQYFKMNGSCFRNISKFDFNLNSDNDYNQSILISDLNSNKKILNINTHVYNRTYHPIADFKGEENLHVKNNLALYEKSLLVSSGSGKVHLFDISGDTFEHKMVFDDEANSIYLGDATAIDSDTIALKGSGNIIYLYQRKTDDFPQNVFKLSPPQGLDTDSVFGSSIALNSKTLAVGTLHNKVAGEVYLYQINGNATYTLTQKLSPNAGIAKRDFFAYKIALNDTHLVVSAIYEDMNNTHNGRYVGAVYLYKMEQNATANLMNKIFSDRPKKEQYFGSHIALDNDTVAICDREALYIYKIVAEKLSLVDKKEFYTSIESLSLKNRNLFIGESNGNVVYIQLSQESKIISMQNYKPNYSESTAFGRHIVSWDDIFISNSLEGNGNLYLYKKQ